ncbi:hypothetical protein [Solirubrobacter deserti]|uniref:LppX_LprAFG lipoprotein n=1 Tax=Solirubrobacter deserti TaxID=2282478 RepID=A0ABT4RQA7_9ACTN|nr:hypothetical protein [Solirubrobacter deserti]MDA0140593.1 hypothetical protein [Solirubrobacter deserti]
MQATAGAEQSTVKLRGPFEVGEKGEAPRFALSADMTAEGRTESAGVVYTGESAFATLDGTTYEVPSLLAGQVTAGIEQALAKGGPLVGIDLKRWVPNPTNAGTANVAGTETIKLTGQADVKRVITDINLLAGQLGTMQVPGMSGAPKQIPADAADHVKDLTVSIYTGADDQMLRRLVVDGTVAEGAQSGNALLDLTLTKVGEDQDIEAPAGARPFNELLQQFQTR